MLQEFPELYAFPKLQYLVMHHNNLRWGGRVRCMLRAAEDRAWTSYLTFCPAVPRP